MTGASFRLCEKDWDFPAAAFENLPIYVSWEKDRMSFWFYNTLCFFGTPSQEKKQFQRRHLYNALTHVYYLFLEPNSDIILNIPIKLLIAHYIGSIAHFVYTNRIYKKVEFELGIFWDVTIHIFYRTILGKMLYRITFGISIFLGRSSMAHTNKGALFLPSTHDWKHHIKWVTYSYI